MAGPPPVLRARRRILRSAPGGRGTPPRRGGAAGIRRAARGEAGVTLVELLVVVAIVSILAVTAIPFAETAVQRRQELALRETLRTTRRAIDAFHDDWRAERMAEPEEVASEAGYPLRLETLVEGVELDEPPGLRRYLRRMPENPFGGGWRLRGHAQDPNPPSWDGEDVYDVAPDTGRLALDGTRIADW